VLVLTTESARAFADHLAGLHRATIVAPTDPAAVGARAILAVLAHLSPALDALAADLETHLERVSITLATPTGSLILLSPSAVADPMLYAMTAAHECQHAAQRESLGFGQVIIDYIGSPELRARAEADAYSVGLYVGFILTGILPLASEAMSSLASATYHLAPEDIELARGVVESHLETMAAGLPPPIAVAVEAHAWLSAL
jgi:hypothetical protein